MSTNDPNSSSAPKENLFTYLAHYFDLNDEKESERATIESIVADVDFRGTKAWILICAILIASLGLNVNSIPVIIGAMLISPLMGPIIGLGLGLGILDFALVRKALRNFAVATLTAIATSTLYFLLTPIASAQSELIARTQPTAFDVLIAFVGGAAGVLAGATRSKGNVIPGVAIATALMPPLCTAGYGLATGQLPFILGAFYLYIINSVFIGLATYVMIKVLKFRKVSFVNKEREKKLRYTVFAIVVCTAVPSVVLGYRLIETNFFEEQQKRFVMQEFKFPNTQMIRHSVSHHGDSSLIEVSLIGEELPESVIQAIRSKLSDYGLKRTDLKVRQGFGSINLDSFRSDIMHDISKSSSDYIKYQQLVIDSLSQELNRSKQLVTSATQIAEEIQALYPEVSEVQFAKSYNVETSDTRNIDTLTSVNIRSRNALSSDQQQRITRWIQKSLPSTQVYFAH